MKLKLVKTRDGRMFFVKDADFKVRAGAREFSSVKSAMERLGVVNVSESALTKALRQSGKARVRLSKGGEVILQTTVPSGSHEFTTTTPALGDKLFSTYEAALKAAKATSKADREKVAQMFRNAGHARINGYGIKRIGQQYSVFKI